MMNAKHTPGKLLSHEMQDREEITIGTDDLWLADMCLSAGFDQTIEQARANAARLVACWNACDGINPEAVPALLAALKRVKKHTTGSRALPDDLLAHIDAALALAERP